ncbi:MAG TPA: SRPBCC family protein [Flavobacterium sp.]|jgi:ligand-binding SRPBCC domain-containing protein|nr:SRPBCC family protein [Flavobacterium sp.]HPJ09135.1 SRPBCC family protein [Flavobacterium sp.]
MKIYTKSCTQQLPITIEQAWDFLSDPKNLQVITPDFMGFNIISGTERSIFPGQIIEYTVAPVLGLKMQWVTEITHVIDKQYFVDEQRFGPYAFWHHKHFLKAVPGGVAMEDIIHYKLPMGVLGQLLHPLLVKPKLDAIFDYRREKLTLLFGSLNS